MNGTVLGIVDNQVIYQDNQTKPNRNLFVVGGPGSYKTQSVVITNLFNETENSIVVTDPKGELYEKNSRHQVSTRIQCSRCKFCKHGTFRQIQSI